MYPFLSLIRTFSLDLGATLIMCGFIWILDLITFTKTLFPNKITFWGSRKTLISGERTSLVAQMVKCLPTMWKTQVLSLGQEDPWRRKWQPTPVLLPGKSPGQRSLVGYSPWGRKESDTTERLNIHFHFQSHHIFWTCRNALQIQKSKIMPFGPSTLKGCCWTIRRRDSWPPEETNSIWARNKAGSVRAFV